MRIQLYSSLYPPSIGGQESFAECLAEGFTQRHQVVTVVCETAGPWSSRVHEIVRRPSLEKRLRLARENDVALVVGATIRGLLPIAAMRKHCVISHQTWYCNDKHPFVRVLRRDLVSRARNIAASNALAANVPAKCAVIPNTYDDEVFRMTDQTVRDRDILFVGRLVSDKGCDVLLQSISLLRKEGLRPEVTLVGTGPELAELKNFACALGVSDQVTFAGTLRDESLAHQYRAHKIVVVPSRWAEPFGIVALEGIACGCVIIGSDQGGLPDAIGPCGLLFQNGRAEALKVQLRSLLTDDDLCARLRIQAPKHLCRHRPQMVVDEYLSRLEAVAKA